MINWLFNWAHLVGIGIIILILFAVLWCMAKDGDWKEVIILFIGCTGAVALVYLAGWLLTL